MSDKIQSDPFHVSARAIGFRFLLPCSELQNPPNKMTRLGGHPGIDRYLQSSTTMSLKSVSTVTFGVSVGKGDVSNTHPSDFVSYTTSSRQDIKVIGSGYNERE
jgi:hypothetical protein